MEIEAVAKKKTRKEGHGKVQPQPEKDRRGVAVTIKGTEEWKAWLERAAKHCRLTVSAFIDFATLQYAKSQGFDEKPPER